MRVLRPGLIPNPTAFPVKVNFYGRARGEVRVEDVLVNSVGEIAAERYVQGDAVAVRGHGRISVQGVVLLDYGVTRRISLHDEQLRLRGSCEKVLHHRGEALNSDEASRLQGVLVDHRFGGADGGKVLTPDIGVEGDVVVKC